MSVSTELVRGLAVAMKPVRPLLLAALVLSIPAPAAELGAVREGKQVVIRAGEREVLRYQAEPGELPRPDIKELFRRGGYIQSLRTPSGRLVTDDFPPNHIHHHGVWTPWTKTVFEGRKPDFWNMGDGTGRVEFVALDGIWSKDGRAGFTTRHRFIDMTAKPEKVVLLETWEVVVSADGERHLIDLALTQTCAGDSPLKLPEYHYGGFGFRGHREWDGVANCRFLTASGKTGRDEVNGSREPWCWVGGKVDGATCGVTILGHPSNFRAPQPVRAHPTEPFFSFAPQQLGEMEITPGKPYTARFRIIVADGEPDPAKAAKWVAEYAAVK
jgi:hypothetical protein